MENGTIDIRSGELGPHRRENMISKLAPVRYEPGARSALWAKFLMRVLPDPEVRAFLARYVGSCLSGDANDRRVLLFYGTGDNGKSVLASVLLRLLGDYAHPARFDSFLESRPDRAGGARSDLMGLRGKRLVTAIEANPGRHFNEGLLKSFAGGSDRITARGLYDRDDTTFAPEAKLLLVANHRPEVQGGGDSIWNRLCEVPFSVKVPKAEQDPHLVRRLCEPIELSSILNWALEGAAEWYAVTEGDRLRPPDAVLRATAAYRTEQDPTAGFVHEQCELGPDYRCTSKALWAAFRAWSEQAGEFLISRKRFGMSMIAEHQCRPVQMGPKRDRGLAGIRLRDVCDSDGGERI